jgi:hypothetical protein
MLLGMLFLSLQVLTDHRAFIDDYFVPSSFSSLDVTSPDFFMIHRLWIDVNSQWGGKQSDKRAQPFILAGFLSLLFIFIILWMILPLGVVFVVVFGHYPCACPLIFVFFCVHLQSEDDPNENWGRRIL